VNSTQMTLTTTAPGVAMPMNRTASLTTAFGGWAGPVGTALPAASPAGLLRVAPISALAGDISVDFRTNGVKVLSGIGISARRPHIEKYVPGIPPRGRPV
jgi:hypothetical protein